jgi:hypothetical protein
MILHIFYIFFTYFIFYHVERVPDPTRDLDKLHRGSKMTSTSTALMMTLKAE